jgi:hypothetical protein
MGGCGPFVVPPLWPLAWLLIAILGCADDGTEKPVGPVFGGRIEGIVQSGGVPVEARVIAELVRGPSGTDIQIACETGSDGSFRLDVPVGSYVVSVDLPGENYYYSAKGPVLHFSEADVLVLRAGEGPHHVAFPFGGLQVRIAGYAIPAEVTCHLDLHMSGSDDYRTFDGRSQSGVLSFDCAGVYPGVYRLKLRIPSSGYYGLGAEEFWLPATRDESLADSVRIQVGQAVLYQRSVWGGSSHLKGEVLGRWHEVDGWADVYFFDADSFQVARTAVGQDGTFDVGLRLPEPVKILVEIHSVQAWVGGRSFRDATLFDCQPGETPEGIRYVESELSIDVQQVGSGAIRYANLTLIDATTRGVVMEDEVSIYPGESSIRIPNLRPGSYLIRLAPESFLLTEWIAQWYDRAGSIDEARVITIPNEGDVVPVTMNLERGGRILGSIETARSDSPFYYRVFVTNASSAALLGWTTVDQGSVVSPFSFTAVGLPDGDYKVGVTLPSYAVPADTVWYPGTTNWSSAEAVAVRDHGDTGGIVISYP